MKNHSIIYLLAAIISSVAGTVHANEVAQAQPNVIFCAESDNNGFQYNQQQRRYVVSRFNENRHTINIRGAFESITIARSGNSSPVLMQCRPSVFKTHSHIRECTNGAGLNFTYNTRNNRFTLSTQFGYVYEEGDSISISYGTCQQF